MKSFQLWISSGLFTGLPDNKTNSRDNSTHKELLFIIYNVCDVSDMKLVSNKMSEPNRRQQRRHMKIWKQ